MASLSTRCFDYHLCPLGGTQLKAEVMQVYLKAVEQGAVELQEIHYDYADGHTWTWSERQLVVYSLAYAQSAQQAFQTRLEHAQTASTALNQSGRGHKAFPLCTYSAKTTSRGSFACSR